MPQQPGHADVAGDRQVLGPALELAGLPGGPVRLAAQQRQPCGQQPQLQVQPPAEHQVTAQQVAGLRQPGGGAVRVAVLHALLGVVLERGDSDLRGAVPAADLQGRRVQVGRLRPGTQAAQHPAGEVHPAPREPRHLPALHLRGVPGEGVQGQLRLAGHRVRKAEEQQRVQGRRGVLHADLAPGRRAQQLQSLGHPALVGAQHAEPGRRGHPVGARGDRQRLAQQGLRGGQVTGRVPDPAAHRQAAGPGRDVAGGQRAVGRELGRLGEPAAEVRGPGADLQRSRAGRGGPRRGFA